MPSHENTLPHADPALAAGPYRSRFLSRSSTLLMSLPLAMGTAGSGSVETISPAAAETSSDDAAPAPAAERLNRAPAPLDAAHGVLHSSRSLGAERTVDSTYRVAVVKDGQLVWAGEEFTPWEDQWMDVPLDKPDGGTTPDGVEYEYSANDVMVGDLDGDGELELILKWDPSNSK